MAHYYNSNYDEDDKQHSPTYNITWNININLQNYVSITYSIDLWTYRQTTGQREKH